MSLCYYEKYSSKYQEGYYQIVLINVFLQMLEMFLI